MSNDGGPAFPATQRVLIGSDASGYEEEHRPVIGMSLRDYFAAKCIQGMLADPGVRDMDEFIKHAPRQAYAVADAMLKARLDGDEDIAK